MGERKTGREWDRERGGEGGERKNENKVEGAEEKEGKGRRERDEKIQIPTQRYQKISERSRLAVTAATTLPANFRIIEVKTKRQNIFLITENDHSKLRILVYSRLEYQRIWP